MDFLTNVLHTVGSGLTYYVLAREGCYLPARLNLVAELQIAEIQTLSFLETLMPELFVLMTELLFFIFVCFLSLFTPKSINLNEITVKQKRKNPITTIILSFFTCNGFFDGKIINIILLFYSFFIHCIQ
jgi:hypothetical protein